MTLPALAAPPLALATGASKAGVPIAAATTSSSWTTAVLQLRLAADDVTPKQRAATTAFVAVLADAGARVLGSAGRVEARVSADVATIAFGATADQPELPVRALDAALRALKTAKPTAVVSPAVLDIVDDDLDVGSAAALLPGRAAGLVVDGGVIDAASFKALADTVRTDRVAVGVVGPGTPQDVLARAVKVLGAPITRGPAAVVAAPLVEEKRTITVEQRKDSGPTSMLSWWTSTPTTPNERAAALVLAELLGGRIARGGDRLGVVVTVTGTDRATLLSAETNKTELLKKLTTTALTATELSTATTTALRVRLARLDDPTRLAHAMSRGLLDNADAAAELAAIEGVNAAAVTAAAIRFGGSTHLTRRAAPAALAPTVVKTTTTSVTTTTTTTPPGAKR